jgi:acetyl esterase/lipase
MHIGLREPRRTGIHLVKQASVSLCLLGLVPATPSKAAMPVSACRAIAVTGDAPPPPAGVSTRYLGRRAPAPYELYSPVGLRRPRGVMLGIHGGAWMGTGPVMLANYRQEAMKWATRGWAFASLDYRVCGRSYADILRLHDLIRAKLGPRGALCVTGDSAGGHLALLLAADRPRSVHCVIARGAPTNAQRLGAGKAYNPSTGRYDSPWPRVLAVGWRSAFGRKWTTRFNPIARTDEIEAPVLVASATADPMIPRHQATSLAARLRRATALLLEPGTTRFPHASISAQADARYAHAEARLTDRATLRWGKPRSGWWPSTERSRVED